MATTAEMLIWIDSILAGASPSKDKDILESIRVAVQRDAERRGEDIAEIVKVEQQRKAA